MNCPFLKHALSREVTCKDAQGQERKKPQYYYRQVYAQLSGPELSVILDVAKPMTIQFIT